MDIFNSRKKHKSGHGVAIVDGCIVLGGVGHGVAVVDGCVVLGGVDTGSSRHVVVILVVVVGLVSCLSLLVDVLLLFPGVVEDLQDAQLAGEDDEGGGNHGNGQIQIDVVQAVTVAGEGTVGVGTPGFFPVAGVGVDDENDEGEGVESGTDSVEDVEHLADGCIVRLENDHGEESSEDEVEGEGDPLSLNG